MADKSVIARAPKHLSGLKFWSTSVSHREKTLTTPPVFQSRTISSLQSSIVAGSEVSIMSAILEPPIRVLITLGS